MGLLNISFGDVLWITIEIFFMIVYFIILFQVIVDVFRREASGWNKALWMLFILVAPFLSLFIYLVVNGSKMSRRQMDDVSAAQSRQAEYIRSVAGGGASPSEQIVQAKQLLDSGAINQAEYDKLKAQALAT